MQERYYIAKVGDNGYFGVWNVISDHWTVMPNHTVEQATTMADGINNLCVEVDARQRRKQTHAFVIKAIRQFSRSVPIHISQRLSSQSAEFLLNQQYRN